MVNGYGCYDMTGNANEWTRSLGPEKPTNSNYLVTYDIDTYPQQEDLNSPRNQYWNARWAMLGYVEWDNTIPPKSYSGFIYKTGNPIYDRLWGLGNRYSNCQPLGFRVIRRYIPDDSAD